ncbi:hypothetical protein [Brevundimonas sp. FT23028]|uniref:hypothetical protein n=1 Tax=Brevundimonas sp. FT23028 TaxID=3393748 RepID=UPI003B588BBA
MKTLILAAAATLIAAPALAQTATPAPLNVEIPEIASVSADPTCGGNAALAQQAFCVTTTQAAINGVVDSFTADFTRQGWIAAGGGDNRVVYVRRREGGGCDGFQMLAFADESRVAAPGAPAWLAFASIPGNVCAGAGTPDQAQ